MAHAVRRREVHPLRGNCRLGAGAVAMAGSTTAYLGMSHRRKDRWCADTALGPLHEGARSFHPDRSGFNYGHNRSKPMECRTFATGGERRTKYSQSRRHRIDGDAIVRLDHSDDFCGRGTGCGPFACRLRCCDYGDVPACFFVVGLDCRHQPSTGCTAWLHNRSPCVSIVRPTHRCGTSPVADPGEEIRGWIGRTRFRRSDADPGPGSNAYQVSDTYSIDSDIGSCTVAGLGDNAVSHRALSAHNVAFTYPSGAEPLVDASLQIPPHSRVALLGANGSGKTTLLRVLAGSLKPSRGAVRIDGVPIGYGRRGLRAHRETVQLVLQNPDDQLFSADVVHDVAFGPVNLGLSATEVSERVDNAMALLSIEKLAQRPIHELSFGERKRVAIAGAMAMRPCVLLMDEPTAGLDPAGVDEMFHALEKLECNATTVVLSTHDTALALQWADSVAVVHTGVVQQGDPRQLLAQAELVAAARLRAPWPLEMAARLASSGKVADGARPRNVNEVCSEIERNCVSSKFSTRC